MFSRKKVLNTGQYPNKTVISAKLCFKSGFKISFFLNQKYIHSYKGRVVVNNQMSKIVKKNNIKKNITIPIANVRNFTHKNRVQYFFVWFYIVL